MREVSEGHELLCTVVLYSMYPGTCPTTSVLYCGACTVPGMVMVVVILVCMSSLVGTNLYC